MSNNRINKINEEVKRELSVVIRELKDARIPLMTSVVRVDVTNDLKYAKAHISVMGADQNETKQALKSASGFIRREIARRLSLRYTPEFIFEIDNSIEYGAHINEICKTLSNDEKGKNDN